MTRFVGFVRPGASGDVPVEVNPDHVESVQAADFNNVKCCRLRLASGEEYFVRGTYEEVTQKLSGEYP